jgi:hypothetical protein
MESKLLQALHDFVLDHQHKIVTEVDEIEFHFNDYWFNKFHQEIKKEYSLITTIHDGTVNWDEYTYQLMGTKIIFLKRDSSTTNKTNKFFDFLIEHYV